MALAAALPVFGGEYAVLANGFRIRAERHEIAGSSVRLYTKDGVIELPAVAVTSFEIEEYIAAVCARSARAATTVREPVKDPATLVRDAARRTGCRRRWSRAWLAWNRTCGRTRYRPKARSA